MKYGKLKLGDFSETNTDIADARDIRK